MTRRRQKEHTREQELAEQRKIWEAMIANYSAIKAEFGPRLAVIEQEITKWELRKADLCEQYDQADEKIAHYQRKLRQAERAKREGDLAGSSGLKTKESKLMKLQRLQREIAELEKSL